MTNISLKAVIDLSHNVIKNKSIRYSVERHCRSLNSVFRKFVPDLVTWSPIAELDGQIRLGEVTHACGT